jgi:murein L,D-transpeptidase YafK
MGFMAARRDALGLIFLALVVLTVGVTCAFARDGRYASQPLPRAARVDRLVLEKDAHLLSAYDGETLLKTYRVAIGSGGAGPKRYEGDGRTPEGDYVIDSRHRSRRFHRFLHVSYPNRDDRERYRRAHRSGEIPDGVGIGGAIGIHGESDNALVRALDNRVDWTAGCIAVADEEIEELFRTVVDGARLEIRP